MKKPIIALTPLVDQEQESVWMLPGYFEAAANNRKRGEYPSCFL